MALAIFGPLGRSRNITTLNQTISFMRAIANADVLIDASVRKLGKNVASASHLPERTRLPRTPGEGPAQSELPLVKLHTASARPRGAASRSLASCAPCARIVVPRTALRLWHPPPILAKPTLIEHQAYSPAPRWLEFIDRTRTTSSGFSSIHQRTFALTMKKA
jgi:hypothetical protein